MEPFHVLLDNGLAAAGAVVPLRQVLHKHAFAEVGLMPWDLVARFRRLE